MSIFSQILKATTGIPEINFNHATPAQILQAAPIAQNLKATYEPVLDNWLRTKALVLPDAIVADIETEVAAHIPDVTRDQVAAVLASVQSRIQDYAVSQVDTFLTHELSGLTGLAANPSAT